MTTYTETFFIAYEPRSLYSKHTSLEEHLLCNGKSLQSYSLQEMAVYKRERKTLKTMNNCSDSLSKESCVKTNQIINRFIHFLSYIYYSFYLCLIISIYLYVSVYHFCSVFQFRPQGDVVPIIYR